MDTTKVLAFLKRLRSEYQETQDEGLFSDNKPLTIAGDPYKLNVWRDFHGTDQIIIFQIKPDSIISTDHCCIGLKYILDDAVWLDHEQLQAIGIP
jgi:hypothetical protein